MRLHFFNAVTLFKLCCLISLSFGQPDYKQTVLSLRCIVIGNGECKILHAEPLPESYQRRLENIAQQQNEKIQIAIENRNITKLDSETLCTLSPQFLLLIPANYLSQMRSETLGKLFLCWKENYVVAKHLMTVVSQVSNVEPFFRKLQSEELPEKTLQIIAESLNSDKFKISKQLLIAEKSSILEYLRPHAILQEDGESLLYMKGVTQDDWREKPQPVQRIWSYAAAISNIPVPLDFWTDKEIRKYGFLLMGASGKELSQLDPGKITNISKLIEIPLSVVQIRNIFDRFYKDKKLSTSDFDQLKGVVHLLSPSQLQQFRCNATFYRKLIFKEKMSLSSAKQIATFLVKEGSNSESPNKITALKQLTFTLPLHQLRTYKFNITDPNQAASLEHKQLTQSQIYLITSGSNLFNKSENFIMKFNQLYKGLPVSFFIKRISMSKLYHQIMSQIPGDSTVRTVSLFDYFSMNFEANNKGLRGLLKNPYINDHFNLLPSKIIKIYAIHLIKHLMDQEVLADVTSQLPPHFLSVLMTAFKNRKLNWETLKETPTLKYLLNGITCEDINSLDVSDFILIMSEFNHQRQKMGKPFPTDLYWCSFQKFMEYLKMKEYLIQRLSSEGLTSFITDADIESLGGSLMLNFPVSELRLLPNKEFLLRSVGKLSLPELMIFGNKMYLRDLAELYISANPSTEIFDLGNLTLFVSEYHIRRINSSMFRVMLESGYLDKRICGRNSERLAWRDLIMKTFGNFSEWDFNDLLTLGEMLIVLEKKDLDSINIDAWKNAGGLFKITFNDMVDWKGSTPFYKVCGKILKEEVEISWYNNAIKLLAQRFILAAQYQLNDIKEPVPSCSNVVKIQSSLYENNEEFTTNNTHVQNDSQMIPGELSVRDLMGNSTQSPESGLSEGGNWDKETDKTTSDFADTSSENSLVKATPTDKTVNFASVSEEEVVTRKFNMTGTRISSAAIEKETPVPVSEKSTPAKESTSFGKIFTGELTTDVSKIETATAGFTFAYKGNFSSSTSKDYNNPAIEEVSSFPVTEQPFTTLGLEDVTKSQGVEESTKLSSISEQEYESTESSTEKETKFEDKFDIFNNLPMFNIFDSNSDDLHTIVSENTSPPTEFSMDLFSVSTTTESIESPTDLSVSHKNSTYSFSNINNEASTISTDDYIEYDSTSNGNLNVSFNLPPLSSKTDLVKYAKDLTFPVIDRRIQEIGTPAIKNATMGTTSEQSFSSTSQTEKMETLSTVLEEEVVTQKFNRIDDEKSTTTVKTQALSPLSVESNMSIGLAPDFSIQNKISLEESTTKKHSETNNTLAANDNMKKSQPTFHLFPRNGYRKNNDRKLRGKPAPHEEENRVKRKSKVETNSFVLSNYQSKSPRHLNKLPNFKLFRLNNVARKRKGEKVIKRFSSRNRGKRQSGEEIKITCDAIKMVGKNAELAIDKQYINRLSDEEINDCVWEFGQMDLTKDVQHQIWNRINKEDLYLAGKLLGSANRSDIEKYDFDYQKPWSLEILQFLTTYNVNKDVREFIANDILKSIEAKESNQSHPEILTALGSSMCQIDNFTGKITPKTILKASVALGRNQLFCEDKLCLNKLMEIITHEEAYGLPTNWTNEDVYSLGYLITGLEIDAWTTLNKENPSSLSRLQYKILHCFPINYIKVFTSDAIKVLPFTTATELKDNFLNVLSDSQKEALSSALPQEIKFETPGYTNVYSSSNSVLTPNSVIYLCLLCCLLLLI